MSEPYTLYHGDCLDVLPTLAPGSVDAIIADIPSGRTACAWDSVIPFDAMWVQLKRIIKPRGAIVLLGCTQPFTSALVMSNPGMFRYDWVWEKDRATGFMEAHDQPLRAHESIVVFSDALPRYSPQKTTGHAPSKKQGKRKIENEVYRHGLELRPNSGATDRYPRSVQRFNTVNSLHERIHPTQKPLALLEYLVLTYTQLDDTVLDFCYGSGTTGHASGNLGRLFIGIEKDAAYFALGRERIATAYAPLRMMEAV